MLALSANSLFDHNRDRRGEKIVKELLKMQNDNGSWTGKSHSITYSTGNALTVERTSIALMALLKSENVPFEQVNKAANYIVKARNGAGDFGNTQSTIMALKALTAYAKYSKKTNENGNIEFYVDGEQVAKASYEAGRKDAIVSSNLAKFVPSGKHLLEGRSQ